MSKLQHKCEYYYVPDSLVGKKPHPGAKFMKYEFQVECLKCHIRTTVYCTSYANAVAEINKYPVLPMFPK